MSRPPFERLVEAHGSLVKGYLVAHLGPADAEDAFQETMIAALRAYDGLRDPAAARAWLLRIAERVAINAHRARARRPEPMAEPPNRADSGAPPSAGVWELARRLPDKQRAALVLRYALDLPYREIADAMGTSEEAARRNVHEALARLRREVEAPSRP